MKKIINVSVAMLMAISLMTACKKGDEVVTAPTKAQTDVAEPDPQLSAVAPVGHLAIGPFNGIGAPYWRYAGGTTYIAVTGSLGNNIIRNAVGGAPLPNVTGLAIVAADAFCLSKPASTANWQIWRFPIGDPNAATLWSTINGTNNIVLSDLEKDPTANRVLALDRTNQRLCQIPFVAGVTNITVAGSYAGIVPNVSGIAMVGAGPFILGQAGATGYLMRCSAVALTPAWALALATYTPPAVPFAFTESGCFYDATTSSTFVVGATGGNWTQTVPAGGPGAAVPPAWLFANIRIIDFSPL